MGQQRTNSSFGLRKKGYPSGEKSGHTVTAVMLKSYARIYDAVTVTELPLDQFSLYKDTLCKLFSFISD